MIKSIFLWSDFLNIAFLLFVVYWLLQMLSRLPLFSSVRQGSFLWLKKLFEFIQIYYIPFSLVTLFVILVGANPLLHGAFILVLAALGYRHIQHYFNGLVFRANPLIEVGTNIIVGKSEGKIEAFFSFGLVLHTSRGERFVHYNDMERHGFSVTHKEDGTLRQTIYLLEDVDKEQIFDLLLENPMVDFDKRPTIRKGAESRLYELKLSLEKGAIIDDVIVFLEDHKVSCSLNKNK